MCGSVSSFLFFWYFSTKVSDFGNRCIMLRSNGKMVIGLHHKKQKAIVISTTSRLNMYMYAHLLPQITVYWDASLGCPFQRTCSILFTFLISANKIEFVNYKKNIYRRESSQTRLSFSVIWKLKIGSEYQ